MITKVKTDTHRKTATIVGVLFIIGTVAGVIGGLITGPLLADPDFLAQVAANENQFVAGTLLVLVMGFPLAMVPVMMYPIFKKYSEIFALGAIIFRGVLEAVCYMALVVSLLLLLTLSQEFVSAGAPSDGYYRTLGVLLVESVDWINLILAIVFSLGALMLYYLFYQSRIIPRWLSLWGLVGGVLYFAAPLVVIFDAQNLVLSVSSDVGILMVPLAIQEMVFAVWLIVKGFDATELLYPPSAY